MFVLLSSVFLSQTLICFAFNDNEHVRGKTNDDEDCFVPIEKYPHTHHLEIAFKFWLQPGSDECYHELLQSGSTLYFIYEILNAAQDQTHIMTYLRHAQNGSLLAFSQTSDRGHLQYTANETTLIDICMDHPYTRSPAKYLSIFIHIYHHEKIMAHYEQLEMLDNVSMSVRTSVNFMIDHLIVSRQTQIELEMLSQRDLYLLYEISHWITKWALLHCFIILSSVLFQTFFIKRFFRTIKR